MRPTTGGNPRGFRLGRCRGGGRVAVGVVLTGPLPHVAGDVDQAIPVAREPADGRGALVAVEQVVVHRKVTLPGVGHHPSPVRELVTPGIGGALETPTGGELPLRLGRQGLARPVGVRDRVGVRHMRHRMPIEAVQGAAGSLGMTPLGTRHPRPPGSGVVEAHRPGGRREHQRTGHELGRICLRKVHCIGCYLRHRDVTCRLDEATELRHRHRMLVHPETLDTGGVDRPLLRVEVLRPHEELTAGDPHHVLRPTSRRTHLAVHGQGDRLPCRVADARRSWTCHSQRVREVPIAGSPAVLHASLSSATD